MDNQNNYGGSQPGMGQAGQPMGQAGPIGQPVQPMQPMVGGAAPVVPTVQAEQLAMKEKQRSDKIKSIIKTVVIIVLSLATATFIGLFVWMYVKWDTIRYDIDGQINEAVAVAEHNLTVQLDEEFAEKEKYPYKTFAGPVDYGELTFEYPKTWSAYIAEAATSGGDFHAYLNPGEVNVVSNETVMALRVSILNTLTEEVMEDYQDAVEDGEMSVTIRSANGINNVSLFEGLLPNDYQGLVAVFKLRDKTVVLQTDAMIFKDDFIRILDTIKYNA